MKISPWDGQSYWKELAELACKIDNPEVEDKEGFLAAKVAVFYTVKKICIFTVVKEGKLLGYVALQHNKAEYGKPEYVFVHEWVLVPEASILAYEITEQVRDLIWKMGYTRIECKVKLGDDNVLRMHYRSGARPISYTVEWILTDTTK